MRRGNAPIRLLGIFVASSPLLLGTWVQPAAAAVGPALAVAPATNPQIEEKCGVDVTLVLDASGSVSQSNAVGDVRNAAAALLDSLSNTDSTARVTQFATFAQQLAPATLVDSASLAPNGVLTKAVSGYYNPIPPRPSTSTIHSYRGTGSPTSSSSYTTANSSTQYTNWDQSLDQAAATKPNLVVYITDGDPTGFDFNHPGDPFPSGDVAVNTDRSTAAEQMTLDRAIDEANRVKANGSRMLAVGVGSALNNPASQNRLVQISGPQIVRDADIGGVTSLNQIDVALVTDFGDLAQLMRSVVLQLCSPSLTIRKLAQTSTDATYKPAAGWSMTVTPRVPTGAGFDWILPDSTPAVSKTLPTDANGFAQFQWEPDPPEADSAATVAESLKPRFTAGRPGAADDFTCELRDEFGNVRAVSGDFANPGAPSFDLDPIGQEIVTCTVYNSFDYAPDIHLTKVNAPTSVRGDLDPVANVTSTFHVTNPGNTPLDHVSVTDDHCGRVRPVPNSGPNSGDTSPQNGLLDPGESWVFRCVQSVATPASTDPDGQNIVNTAEATGTDPEGTVVTDNASDDVDAFNPAIDIVKQVDGSKLTTVPSGRQVTYTYAVSNEGNTPLGSVSVADDTEPCTDPVRGPDGPGNGDNVLDVGETWTYSCDLASPTRDVINTASVTGTPLDPTRGDEPFPNPNPDVRATDTAEVRVVNPAVELTKTATPDVVLLDPGSTPPPEGVTYTFDATNTGDAPLNRPGAATGGPGAKDPGWVIDRRCMSPTTYVSGDTDGNDLLDPDETWEFTCQGAVIRPTLNIARIVGQPSDADGDPLPGIDPVRDRALALVEVARPGVAVDKTALRPVVLDPDATPVVGPDAPTPRQAEYLYTVTNTGNVPLSLTPDPPVDPLCAPLAFAGGDANGDDLLDPDEVWQYTCETLLGREQANRPPVSGDESGLVQNTVTVTGVPFFDGSLVPDKSATDQDTAQVTVIEPGIAITKRASAEAVEVGGDVTYTIVVRNTGDVGLDPIGPADSKCSPLVYQSGDDNHNGLLDGADSGRNERWIYTCTRAIGLPEAPATTDHNVAAVSAVDPLGNLYVASDNADVAVLAPAIALTKTVSDTLVPAGSRVTYGFDVTNAGQSPVSADDVLTQVTLADTSDPANPSCAVPRLVSKTGGNQDDVLDRDPPEVWHYQCRGTITRPTTDTAIVRGHGGSTFGFDIAVSDTDGAFVDAFHPGIEVTKTASPTLLVGGGTVTYTYEVRNTGDVPLADVESRIADDTCAPLTYVSGDKDGDGLLDTPVSIFEDAADETWTFTCRTDVDVTTRNTVVATGTPVDAGGDVLCGPSASLPRSSKPCDVRDSDTALVTVVVPGTVVIRKQTNPASSTPFAFVFDGHHFSLTDGESTTFDDLTPGAFDVRELARPGSTLVSLHCHDPSGGTTTDADARSAHIALAAGETVTCTFTNEQTSGENRPPVPPTPPGSGDNLPPTGASTSMGPLIAIGLGCLVVGAGLIGWARLSRQSMRQTNGAQVAREQF